MLFISGDKIKTVFDIYKVLDCMSIVLYKNFKLIGIDDNSVGCVRKKLQPASEKIQKVGILNEKVNFISTSLEVMVWNNTGLNFNHSFFLLLLYRCASITVGGTLISG